MPSQSSKAEGQDKKYDAIILGAGVLGLTIALELAQKGLKVIIAARDLPEDIHSTAFSSPWAGASFVPWAENEIDARREERTYHRFRKLVDSRPDLVAETHFRYGFNTPGVYPKPLSSKHLVDWRYLQPEECPGPFKLGVGFTSLTLNPPAYTLYLLSQLSELGVTIHRTRVSSIYEAFSLPTSPASPDSPRITSDLVINATGLGALSLLGVSDPLVHPAKGQTMTIRASKVKEGYGIKEPRTDPKLFGQQVYIIPRPGSGGLVTVGGCYLKGDWSTHVDPVVAERILREATELCPDLKGEDGKVEVVSHNVGLRPCRVGGVRVELEEIDLGKVGKEGILPGSVDNVGNRKVAVVHAYGVGGAGYQDSFGIAEDAAELAIKYLNSSKAPKSRL